MTWSAPAAAANCAFSGLLTVAMTVASAQWASWIAALPTAPAPPWTRTVRPSSEPGPRRSGSDSATVRQRCAVRNGTPSDAPSSKDGPAPRSTVCRAGARGVVGLRPEGALVGRLPDPPALAHEHRIDALADGLDRPGAVLVRDL